MAINLAIRYPGRATPADSNYPQGAFKNKTAPLAEDGTLLEKDWANDQFSFMQALILRSGITINGTVDNATNSQYYTALRSLTTTPAWVNTINYTTPSLVFGSNGQLYIALAASGPSTTPRDPISQPTFWQLLSSFLGITTKLLANTTIYVSTTGSDANNGLTAGAPFLTIQAAYNAIQQRFDLNGYTITLQLADGTYTAGLLTLGLLSGQKGASTFIINGNSVTPSNVIISTTSSDCLSAIEGSTFTVRNLRLQTTTAGNGISAFSQGRIFIGAGVVFGACASQQMIAATQGFISILNNYSIVGGAVAHMHSQGGGNIFTNGVTVTLTGTPAYSNSFAYAQDCGVMTVSGMTYSGSATGIRYKSNTNSVIQTAGGGANYFPGNAVGTTATGGQYV